MKKISVGLSALLFLLAIQLAPFGAPYPYLPGPANSTNSASRANSTSPVRMAEAAVLTGKTGSRAAELAEEVASLAREGDIIFQITSSPQSRAIQLATGSEYTHCGILLEKDGRLQVFEAVRTVSWTPLENWLGRGIGRRYVLMRLKDPAPLTPRALAAMRRDSANFLGKEYDIFFQWDDAQIYCSELVWKLYQRDVGIELCPLSSFRDYNLDQAEVRRIAIERYGKDIPLDTQVTAPSDIMASKLLEVIAKK